MTKDIEETPDIVEYNHQLVPRMDWMKWYYSKWAEGTSLFDAEQKGWYMNLLMYAASMGNPPGYLPDDEDTLKDIAGFTEFPTDLVSLLTKGFNADVLQSQSERNPLASMVDIRLKRWLKVRSKFRSAPDLLGAVYNPRLYNTLKEGYDRLIMVSRAGKVAADARWNNKKRKAVNAVASKNNAFAMPSAMLDIKSKDLKKLGSYEPIKESLEIPDPKPIEEPKVKGKRGRRAEPEIEFDEKKFQLTDEMEKYILLRYPDTTEVDFDYWNAKFINYFTGKSRARWKRTYYNFVINQVEQYHYTPGRKGKVTPRDGSNPTGKAPAFESATERNTRNEAESEQRIRELLSKGNVGDQTDSTPEPNASGDSLDIGD